MTMSILAALLAVPLFILGRWGRKNAPELTPRTSSTAARADAERVIRRGSVACQVFAAFFVVLGLAEIGYWAVHR